MGQFLSISDLGRLRDTTDVLLNPGAHADLEGWGVEILRRLEALFNADRSLIFLPAPDGLLLVTESVPSEMVGAFRSAFSQIEQGQLRSDRPDVDAVLEARASARMEVFTNQALLGLTAGSPEMVPWYHEVIVPSGVRHGSGLALSHPAGEAWLCVAYSRPADDPFGVECGLELLRALLPAFRAGVEQVVSESQRHGAVASGLECLGARFVAYDLDGREITRSSALTGMLAADPDGVEVLTRVQRMAAEVTGLRRRPTKGRPTTPAPAAHQEVLTSAGPYQLRCVFLPPETLARDEAVVVVVDPPGPRLPSPEELRHRYGLTGREAETTLLLAEGGSNHHIARELGVSPHTVRTHAERIFRKVGVRSRKALGLKLLAEAHRNGG